MNSDFKIGNEIGCEIDRKVDLEVGIEVGNEIDRKVGLDVGLEVGNEKFMFVDSVEYIGNTMDEYIYDLETEDHTYYAGSGYPILLKNTDSCYVTFGIDKDDFMENGVMNEVKYMEKNFIYAQNMADTVSNSFKSPVELEFEKFMYPFMIFSKKRYAYLEWVNFNAPKEKIQYKGLSVKRRDFCKYIGEVSERIYTLLMKYKTEDNRTRGSTKLATKELRTCIDDLLNDRVPIEKLVITKSLKDFYRIDSEEIYWNKPLMKGNKILKDKNGKPMYHPKCSKITGPHVQLAMKLRDIDPENAPKPPDRVPYVFIRNAHAVLQHERVEHPDYLSGKQIDSLYYFEKQLEQTILTLFGVLTPNIEDSYRDLVIKKQNDNNKQTSMLQFMTNNPSKLSPLDKVKLKESDKKELKEEKEEKKQPTINSFFKKKSSLKKE